MSAGLPWARLDSNIASHDKILALLADPSPQKWRAWAIYMAAIGWSVGQGTDGRIPRHALAAVHGTTQVATLLRTYGLWDDAPGGWQIRNFAERQRDSGKAAAANEAKRRGGAKGNCIKHHGPECWDETYGCQRAAS